MLENNKIGGTVFLVSTSGEKQAVEYEGTVSLLAALLKKNIEISNSCEGMGTCGTCRLTVLSDLNVLEKRNEIEQEMADDRSFSETERLACQINCVDGLAFRLPED
ncbi:MAG: 2Fe-2S iron-sulfur cluster-binding protein [Bdellovibrionales bacterium]